MSDLISKYDVLEICKEQIWNGADDYYPISANKIAKKVKELPTVDAVPVIRCKDCKWCVELHDIDTDTIVPYLQCTNWNGMTDADGYCCAAERKDNDSKQDRF